MLVSVQELVHPFSLQRHPDATDINLQQALVTTLATTLASMRHPCYKDWPTTVSQMSTYTEFGNIRLVRKTLKTLRTLKTLKNIKMLRT